MIAGIASGLFTCALWGLTFVAPRTIAPLTAWDLAAARYGVFGLASALLMLHPRFRPKRMSLRHLATGLGLGVIAAPGYFVSAAYAVQCVGPAVPPLIIGLAPALLAVIANRGDAAVPWRVLAGPLGLILVGLAAINGEALHAAGPASGPAPWSGLALSLIALTAWIGFGFVNAAVMRGRSPPDGLQWTGVQGIGAGIGALVLMPMISRGTAAPSDVLALFWVWALLMGVAGSWFATWCWVVASRRLPLGILSQLIVAETVFGLLYGFLFERRWPTATETIGSTLQLLGVALAIALFTRSSTRVASVECPTGEEIAVP